MPFVQCKCCGSMISDQAAVCPKCGQPNQISQYQKHPTQNMEDPKQNVETTRDKANFGWKLLSFLIPLVGLILYFAWRKDTPKKAQSCLYYGIGGFISNLLILTL